MPKLPVGRKISPFKALGMVADAYEVYQLVSGFIGDEPDPNEIINQKLDTIIENTENILIGVEAGRALDIKFELNAIKDQLMAGYQAYEQNKLSPTDLRAETAITNSENTLISINTFLDSGLLEGEELVLALPMLISAIRLRYDIIKDLQEGDTAITFAQELTNAQTSLNNLWPIVDDLAEESVTFYARERLAAFNDPDFVLFGLKIYYAVGVETGTEPYEAGPLRFLLTLPTDTDDLPDYIQPQDGTGVDGYNLDEEMVIDIALFRAHLEANLDNTGLLYSTTNAEFGAFRTQLLTTFDDTGLETVDTQAEIDAFFDLIIQPVIEAEQNRARLPEILNLAFGEMADWLNGDDITGTGDDDANLTHVAGQEDGNNRYIGNGGSDTITGGNGDDVLVGNDPNATGSNPGNDILFGGAGRDNLFGNGGDDVLDGGAGNDRIEGGAGIDTASYATSSSGVTVDISSVIAQDTGGSAPIRSGTSKTSTGAPLVTP